MTKKTKDLTKQVIKGVIASHAIAIERARQTGTTLVVWRQGKIVHLDPNKLKPKPSRTRRK